ncbi:hypothetical protein WKT22_02027 [Candidatus Lokiarchaeum ossiferum]
MNKKLKIVSIFSIITLIFCNFCMSTQESVSISEKDANYQIDYLIVTPQDFIESVIPLALWKTQRGITSAIISTESLLKNFKGSDDAEKIRNGIAYYQELHNISWILLAGNNEFIPVNIIKISSYPDPVFNFIASDQYYSNLDQAIWKTIENELGEDYLTRQSIYNSYKGWESEVFLGRFPAENRSEVANWVQQQIKYEQAPPIGPWMNHAILAGGFITFEEDRNNDGLCLYSNRERPECDSNAYHNWLNSTVIPENWTRLLLAEASGVHPTQNNYDVALNSINLVKELNKGATLINIGAHGWEAKTLHRTIFQKDIDQDSMQDIGVDAVTTREMLSATSDLNSEEREGFYFIESCTIGEFYHKGDLLIDKLLNQNAIGIIASAGVSNADLDWDNNSRTRPGGWNQGLSSRFWEQILIHGINQPGKALEVAKRDYMASFQGTLSKITSADYRTIHQFNLFGDPEVPLWMGIPNRMNVTFSNNSGKLQCQVLSNSFPLDSATITLINSTFCWKGQIDNNGMATLPISSENLQDVTITISKNKYIPYQKTMQETITTYPCMLLDSRDDVNTNSIATPILTILIFGFFGVVFVLNKGFKNKSTITTK